MIFDRFGDEIIWSYSTRKGGVSSGPYESMNLAFSTGDDPEKIRENYSIWCGSLGVDTRDTVMVHQTHTNNVIRVDSSMKGQGLFRPKQDGIDGMVTDEPGLAMITSHADCVPVYLYDPVRRAAGLAHAGWRGTTAEIARVTVEKMREEFHTDPSDIFAWIGPCISQRRFECDSDVVEAVRGMSIDGSDAYYYDEENGKYHVSLRTLNRLVLEDAGIPHDHTGVSGDCTYDMDDLYFSHRRMGSVRGGQAALLAIRRP